jgi:hypothetical protein
MVARGSLVASQLLLILALCLKMKRTSQLTLLHILGPRNRMAHIPPCLFGSKHKWHCKSDEDLLTLFNSEFPLSNQQSWTVFRPSTDIFMKVLSVLRMQQTAMDVWSRLTKAGRFIGDIGSPTAGLWDWTVTYRALSMKKNANTS